MANETPPYMNAYGSIDKVLDKICVAQTPPRFTQDFLGTTLGFKASGTRPIIPFLKRLGFLGSDGVPTDRYNRFRNPNLRGAAAAEALRDGYKVIYKINEYAHDASDKDLLGVVLQATGMEENSSVAKAIVQSFLAVKKFAKFDEIEDGPANDIPVDNDTENAVEGESDSLGQINQKLGLSYTINLNLPPTSDIKVFDAIFKSLKENLLK